MKRTFNWKVAGSAFALTALIAYGTAAMQATNAGLPAQTAAIAPLPPDHSNAQMKAALPADLTVTPNNSQNAHVVALPGGAQVVNALFITSEEDNVVSGQLTATVSTKVMADNQRVNVAPAPDIAEAASNHNTLNANTLALAPTTAIARAGTLDTRINDANNASATANNASATATAASPTNTVAALHSNSAIEDHGTAFAPSPHLEVAPANMNRTGEALGTNSALAANIDRSDHGASAHLSVSNHAYATNTAAIAVS